MQTGFNDREHVSAGRIIAVHGDLHYGIGLLLVAHYGAPNETLRLLMSSGFGIVFGAASAAQFLQKLAVIRFEHVHFEIATELAHIPVRVGTDNSVGTN